MGLAQQRDGGGGVIATPRDGDRGRGAAMAMPRAALRRLSDVFGWFEARACQTLAAALPMMILVNVGSRAIGQPIFWMDELAIYTMVWLAMFGLALTIHTRDAVSVTLLQDAVPGPVRRLMRVLSDLIVVAFAAALVVLSYLWFDPITFARSGFDVAEFSAQTFNYIYQEPTATLGIAKTWFWLIVPLVAVTTLVHGLDNLCASAAAMIAGRDGVAPGAGDARE